MAAAAPLGASMSSKRVTACLAIAVLLSAAASSAAEQRFALIVCGAAGGPDYAAQYDRWGADLSKTLIENLQFDPTLVTLLSDTTSTEAAATAENVRRVVSGISTRMTRDDVLFVLLIGHGTFDGADAKFNLVGPDLESAEWSALFKGLSGRVVIVNTSSASFPFLERLAAPRRVVITSTDSPAQRYDTVFAGYFIRALVDPSADLDKNERISIWEAFASASASVKRYYQQRGQLSTEHALLDDTGDGVGNEATTPGDDGSLAARTYLDETLPGSLPTDEVLLKLLQRKATIESELEDLKIRRQFLTRPEYAKEFERLMIELAQVSHDIRERTKS
jgi:hypothetical protein